MFVTWILLPLLVLGVTGAAVWFAYHPDRIPQPAGSGVLASAARWLVRFAAWARDWITRVLDRLRGKDEPPPVQAVPPAPPPPAGPPPALPVVAEPVMPSLEGVAVPAEWASLAARIAAFEPDNDSEFVGGIQGEAAGILVYSEAWQEQADTLLTAIGLDPNATEAVAALGEVLADTASDFGMVIRRFLVIYGQILKAISEDGVILPHNAREWLTGEVA